MQLQGELQDAKHQRRVYTGPFQGLRVILRNEGLKGIYSGLGPGSMYQLVLNGSRLGFYEPIRTRLNSIILRDPGRQSMSLNAIAGATSGAIGAILGSPLFLIKTRQQSYSTATPSGAQHSYKGTLDGLRSVYRADGLMGLYRGCTAAVIRTGMGSSVQLPMYFLAKRELSHRMHMKEGPMLHLTSSTFSGFSVCVVMHPAGGCRDFQFLPQIKILMVVFADTIMSRMYNQNGNLYRNVFDCFAKTIVTEGVMACYKGFLPHLVRILPHTVLTLTLAEQTKSIMQSVERTLVF